MGLPNHGLLDRQPLASFIHGSTCHPARPPATSQSVQSAYAPLGLERITIDFSKPRLPRQSFFLRSLGGHHGEVLHQSKVIHQIHKIRSFLEGVQPSSLRLVPAMLLQWHPLARANNQLLTDIHSVAQKIVRHNLGKRRCQRQQAA